jgi:hypothetical protein
MPAILVVVRQRTDSDLGHRHDGTGFLRPSAVNWAVTLIRDDHIKNSRLLARDIG